MEPNWYAIALFVSLVANFVLLCTIFEWRRSAEHAYVATKEYVEKYNAMHDKWMERGNDNAKLKQEVARLRDLAHRILDPDPNPEP